MTLCHHGQVHILQVGRHRLGFRAGLFCRDYPHFNPIHAPDRTADQNLLFECGQLLAGGNPFPHKAFHLFEQQLGIGVNFQVSLVEDGNIRYIFSNTKVGEYLLFAASMVVQATARHTWVTNKGFIVSIVSEA